MRKRTMHHMCEVPPQYELDRQAIRNACCQCHGTGVVLSSNAKGDEYLMQCLCVAPTEIYNQGVLRKMLEESTYVPPPPKSRFG
jgi:hypothetical protein